MIRRRYMYMIIAILLVVGVGLFFQEEMRVSTALKQTKILLDPGHGGQDPGKVIDGFNESEINLQFAFLLAEIMAEKGYLVELTRTENAGLTENGNWNKDEDMRMRKEKITASECDIFISIHQNSYADTSCKGAQVFYSDNLQENMILADLIQDNLKEISSFENKRTALINNDYYVLRDNNVPSVIIECGFMTNPQELELLTDNNYRRKLANAISDAIVEFCDKN